MSKEKVKKIELPKRFWIDVRQCICVAVTLFFLSFSIWRFPYVYGRLLSAVKNLFISLAYYFTQPFYKDLITVTVNELPTLGDTYVGFSFPFEWSALWTKICAFFQMAFSLDGLGGFFTYLNEELFPVLVPLLDLLLLAIIGVFVAIVVCLGGRNMRHGRKTEPMKRWETFSRKILDPVRDEFARWHGLLSVNAYWKTIWKCVWLFNFNLFAVAVDGFAYLWYFFRAFDVVHIYFQVYKLALDTFDMFTFVPLWLWLVFAFVWWDSGNFKLADRRRRVMQLDNRDYIAQCPIVCMICAEPGAGKTTQMVSMGREMQVMFRRKALDIMMNCDLKFPNFEWLAFEKCLQGAIRRNEVINLFTARCWVRSIADSFVKNPSSLTLFGYDYKHYGMLYNDGLNVRNLFEVLDDYARAYFIYMVQTSLIFSNFSAASDDICIDGGNLARWNMDYFSRNPEHRYMYRKYSHIFNWDFIRLGRKFTDNPEYTNMFEFGIILITEIGKERGNTLENKEYKRDSEEPNPLNDYVNAYIKMCRHLATIDGFPFVRFFCDEQRPETWGADARDLAGIIRIVAQERERLAVPCYHLRESLLRWIVDSATNEYLDYRFRRGDKGLLIHAWHNLAGYAKRKLDRLYGEYGFKRQINTKEKGTLDGEREERVYYLVKKVTYDDAFATDCFSEVFAHRVSVAEVGIDQVETFKEKVASIVEMSKTNSYFYDTLTTKYVA